METVCGAFAIIIIVVLLILKDQHHGNHRTNQGKHSNSFGNHRTSSAGNYKAQTDHWVSTEDFQIQKSLMKPNCSEEQLDAFLTFLRQYKGGYVRRRNGRIAVQDYLGREKGDLKGIFYHVVLPNPNLSVSSKEEFRKYLLSVGVRGMEERPSYEVREGKLKNKYTDEDLFERKAVGNRGEQTVRDLLSQLGQEEYYVINGPAFRSGEEVQEYDHIVIGTTGVFLVETKAFGMTDGHVGKATLVIGEDDRWILQKERKSGETNREAAEKGQQKGKAPSAGTTAREVTSPSDQIARESRILQSLLTDYPVVIHPVLALSNTELQVDQRREEPYDILTADRLVSFIKDYPDRMDANDRMNILTDLNHRRIN